MSYLVVGRRPPELTLRPLKSCRSRGDAQLHERRFRDEGYVDLGIRQSVPAGSARIGRRQ